MSAIASEKYLVSTEYGDVTVSVTGSLTPLESHCLAVDVEKMSLRAQRWRDQQLLTAGLAEPTPQTIRSHGAGGHVIDEPRPEPFISRDSHGNAIDQILRGDR